ncbi:hypothetical protein JG687_00001085 [Phytophthora cactorum]|uniref:Uncharacterized protein n=1 Tax=Phytophthora cactorum TaxID=29920 RepID=A0A8T1V0U9_9STRA|nr:hypothetical protein PC121_g12626 [Phytophthora cactorum]KAG3199816.1 hypothetical protein PC128_g5033 [Phytophthora cactorum]KAG4051388.1 hypothetical protein PC123_g13397 [Phytophthora cactorum]KAG6973092.1 hypothetical protein JG687_00001085 [Phytophthora cactorum]
MAMTAEEGRDSIDHNGRGGDDYCGAGLVPLITSKLTAAEIVLVVLGSTVLDKGDTLTMEEDLTTLCKMDVGMMEGVFSYTSTLDTWLSAW